MQLQYSHKGFFVYIASMYGRNMFAGVCVLGASHCLLSSIIYDATKDLT